jgi:hypothetical protein
VPGFFAPGIAPAAHGARCLWLLTWAAWCLPELGPRPFDLDAWRVVPVPYRLGPGPRCLVRDPWPAPGGCLVRAAGAGGRVCVCDPRSPVFVIQGYKHPGPRRLVRDPCALVLAAWCMPGQVRPARPGPRSLGRGPWTWWPVDGFMRPGA